MDYDAVVVGGAVAGSRTAELLARQGRNILLLEDSAEVGKPCKCTGLVSWRIKEILPNLPDDIIVNVLRDAKFFSPNGMNFRLTSPNPVYMLDRPALDRFLFRQSMNAGVETHVNEKFLQFSHSNGHLEVKTDAATYTAKMLIGADGANSTVGKQAGLEYPEKFWVGVQTTAEGEFDSVELWFGSKISPNFFAWVAPENKNTARIGLATNPNASKYYQDFLRKRIGKVVPPDVGGIIRGGLMKETAAGNVLVVGDAACQIKPYSGGGINYGLIASQVAADAVVKAFEKNNFSKEFLMQNYDMQWKKILGPAIKRGALLHKILSSNNFVLDTLFGVGRLGSRMFNRLDMDLINVFG